MPESKRTRVLTIRLPEGEAKRFEKAANAQPSESPESSFDTLYALQGSLKDVDVLESIRQEKEFELEKEGHQVR